MKIDKKHVGIITLAAGHSLVLGDVRKQEQFGVKNDQSSFGLLNLGSNESIESYKNATQALESDLEDFIYPIYRGLSETIVRKHFDPIDFSESGVLKASMALILGQTVYTNHFAYVGNEVGSVKDVFWEESYKIGNLKIPAGFNLQLAIDAKSNQKLARGIMMDPPSVHSNSVTVNFEWEPSHPKMEYHEFRANIGKLGPDGKLVRRIASEIHSYYETSLVSHGADPFANKVGEDGKIVLPKLAAKRDSFSAELGASSDFHFFSYKHAESFSADPTEGTIPDNNNNKDKQTNLAMNKKLALALAAAIGFQLEETVASLSEQEFEENPENVAALLAKLVEPENLTKLESFSKPSDEVANLTAQVTALQTQVTEKETENASLTAEKVSLEAQAKDGETYKAELLADTISKYNTASGKPNEALEATFAAADVKTLKAFNETYTKQLEGQFKSICQDCGSDKVARNSASAGEDTPEGGKTDNRKLQLKSLSELRGL